LLITKETLKHQLYPFTCLVSTL